MVRHRGYLDGKCLVTDCYIYMCPFDIINAVVTKHGLLYVPPLCDYNNNYYIVSLLHIRI